MKRSMQGEPNEIWTIGHSNRPLEVFLELLERNRIALLADVRLLPGSRMHPHFNQENLVEVLGGRGVEYRHFPDLGGRRSTRLPDSPNKAWEVKAFNAYADHMQTEPFRRSIETLMEAAIESRTAVMCSEAVPWRCHRRLIGDFLLMRGWLVRDIISESRVTPHQMTKFAQVVGDNVIYPANELF